MKKIIFILVFFQNLTSDAQTYVFYQTDSIHNQLRLDLTNGEVYQIQDDGQKFLVHAGDTSGIKNDDRYVLYKTKNMWTYLLLDKCTGRLWQCQHSAEGIEHIFCVAINDVPLSDSPTSKFSIQPLVSMYQHYLINQETGEKWKFQWSTDKKEHRWIIKI